MPCTQPPAYLFVGELRIDHSLADLVMADATDLGECQALHAVRTINDEPVDDVERAGLGLQQHAGEIEDFLSQVAGSKIHGFAADRRGARAERAAAEWRRVGVA